MLRVLAWILLIPAVFAAAVYAVLRSPWMETQVWPVLRPLVAEHTGLDISVDRLRVDLLRGVELRGLQLHRVTGDSAGCGPLEISLDRLDLAYRPIALLKKRLRVDHLAVAGLDARGCLRMAPDLSGAPDLRHPDEPRDAPPMPGPVTAAGDPVQALLHWLDRPPPLEVRIQRLQLTGIRLDGVLQVPESDLDLAWRGGFELEAALDWRDGYLGGNMRASLASEQPFRWRIGAAEPGPSGSFTPHMRLAFGWLLQRDGVWALAVEPLSLEMELSALEVDWVQPDWRFAARIPQYQLALNQERPGRLSLRLDDDWPMTVDLEWSSLGADANLEFAVEAMGPARMDADHLMEASATGVLPLRSPTLDALRIDARSALQVRNLQAVYEGEPIRVDRANMQLDLARAALEGTQPAEAAGDSAAGDPIDLRLDLSAFGLTSPLGIDDLTLRSRLRAEPDLGAARIEASLALAQWPLMDLQMALRNEPERLVVRPELRVTLPGRDHPALPSVPALAELAGSRLDLEGEIRWQHFRPRLLALDALPLSRWRLASDLDIRVADTPFHGVDALPRLLAPLTASVGFAFDYPGNVYRLSVRADSLTVEHPELEQPLPLSASLAAEIDREHNTLRQRTDLRLNGMPLLDWDLRFAETTGQARVDGRARVHLDPAWSIYRRELDSLAVLGPVVLDQTLDLELDHPDTSLAELDWANLDSLRLRWEGKLTQRDPGPERLFRLPEPLSFNQELVWARDGVSVDGRYAVPALRLQDDIEMRGLDLRLEARARSLLDLGVLRTNLRLRQDLLQRPGAFRLEGLVLDADVSVEQIGGSWVTQIGAEADGSRLFLNTPGADRPGLELAALAFPLTLEGLATLSATFDSLLLDDFHASLGRGWLEQDLSGDLALDGQTALLAGTTVVHLRDGLFDPWFAAMRGSGSLRLPWQVNRVDGRQLSLTTEAQFQDLFIAIPGLILERARGQVLLEQDLEIIDNERIAFTHLLSPETFQRVDFGQVSPYLGSRDEFSLERIQWGPLDMGPLRATVPVQQNLLRVEDFSLALLGGDLAGNLYLDVTPGAWRLGLLGRLSHLDLGPLFPEIMVGPDDEPVNGRVAIEFDLIRRLLEGRIDITEITRTRLLQILDLVDPDQRDAQMSNVRSALRIAHPRWVTVQMQNGLMDISLGLSALSAPVHVRGLPLSPIIERFGAELLKMPDALPLEAFP